jgi:2-dehydro-3-deoxyphosphogluconate aldolase/(4S)-4-hydroxy-2-oxoglutarate aldolase
VVRAAQTHSLPFYPGIATPTDIERACQLGCKVMKFFPAEPSGGLAYLQSIAAPYEHLGIRYIPLGGIREGNLQAYLANPLVLAIGGTWLAPKDLIQARDWKTITRNAAAAFSAVQTTRIA